MRFRRTFPTLCLAAALAALGLSAAAGARPAAPTKMDFPPALQIARTIAAEELLTSAQRLLPKGAFLGPLLDARYSVIKHDWMVRRFIPFYREALIGLREAADGGGAEGADCDDFSMFLRHEIGIAGMLAGTAQPAAAKVVVLQDKAFSGVGRTRERHAIGLFLTDQGWFVLEPQSPTGLVPIASYPNRNELQYVTFH